MSASHNSSAGASSLNLLGGIAACLALSCAALSVLLLFFDAEEPAGTKLDSNSAYDVASGDTTPLADAIERSDGPKPTVPPGGVLFSARLVDGEGHVLPLLPLELRWMDGHPLEAVLATDLWGRFTCSFAAPLPQGPPTLRLKTSLGAFERNFEALRTDRTVEGGDWVLPLTLIAASGVVLDEHKTPIAGATIYGDFAAQTGASIAARSDHAGRFVLHAPEARGGLRLRVEHPRYEEFVLNGCVAGAPASLNLRLQLGAATSLSGSARLPLDVPASAIQVRISTKDPEPITMPLDASGRFSVPTLRAKRVRIEWLGPSTQIDGHERTVLATEDELELKPGVANALATRDLTNALHFYRFRLLQRADGAPHSALETHALIRSRAGELRRQYLRSDASGQIALALEADTSELYFVAEKLRVANSPLPARSERSDIILSPPFELVVPVHAPDALAARDSVRTRIEYRGGDPLLQLALDLSACTRVLGWEGQSLQVHVANKGAYEVTLDFAAPPSLSATFDVDAEGIPTNTVFR